jgi:hypothetical protein
MTTSTTTTAACPTATCPECGHDFPQTRAGKVYCSSCRVTFQNLCLTRGKSIVPLLVTWRRHRNAPIGKTALRELCRIASMYIEEDRADGREAAIQVDALLTGFLPTKFDRVPRVSGDRASAARTAKREQFAHAA